MVAYIGATSPIKDHLTPSQSWLVTSSPMLSSINYSVGGTHLVKFPKNSSFIQMPCFSWNIFRMFTRESTHLFVSTRTLWSPTYGVVRSWGEHGSTWRHFAERRCLRCGRAWKRRAAGAYAPRGGALRRLLQRWSVPLFLCREVHFTKRR